jgi:hypothetical protein
LPLPQTKDGFGSGTSPIIYDGLVYLLRDEDGPGQGLYAFDVKSGKEVWKRKRDGFRVSFGSPVIWDGGVVVIGDLRVKSYDPKTGADRWVARGLAAYPCTTPAPGSDGNLYIATWSNGSSNERNMPEWKDFLAAMDKDKDGKITKSDSEGTFLADFFAIFDKNKNGLIDAEEWQSSLDFMSRGKNVVLAIKPGGAGDITDTLYLPVGSFVTYTATGTLSPNARSLSNTAAVMPPAGVGDSNPANNTATDTDVVLAADLSVTQTADPGPVVAKAAGVRMWWYRGGPWEPVATELFAG